MELKKKFCIFFICLIWLNVSKAQKSFRDSSIYKLVVDSFIAKKYVRNNKDTLHIYDSIFKLDSYCPNSKYEFNFLKKYISKKYLCNNYIVDKIDNQSSKIYLISNYSYKSNVIFTNDHLLFFKSKTLFILYNIIRYNNFFITSVRYNNSILFILLIKKISTKYVIISSIASDGY